jgi:DnaK suppressor protein
MSTTAATSSKALTKKELKKFQELLEEKRKAVLERAREMLAVENMALDTNDLPDEMDLASSEYLQSFEFRLRGREKSLLSKLDLALKKIDDGTFGVCEVCEEPIGKKRLEARPETTLCIKCKEDQEREERTMG